MQRNDAPDTAIHGKRDALMRHGVFAVDGDDTTHYVL